MNRSSPVRSVLLIVAMEQEALPIVERFGLKRIIAPGFLRGWPFVAWRGDAGAQALQAGLQLYVVWTGRDSRYGQNNVGTAAAAVATYAAVAALGMPDLVLSVGAAGGFSERGAAIDQVRLPRAAHSGVVRLERARGEWLRALPLGAAGGARRGGRVPAGPVGGPAARARAAADGVGVRRARRLGGAAGREPGRPQ